MSGAMGRRVIRLGDATDHGGRVLASGAPQVTVGGRPVALVGDACSCPRRGHGGCVVAEGDPTHTVGGRPVAYEGHRTSCGARLVASTPHFGKG